MHSLHCIHHQGTQAQPLGCRRYVLSKQNYKELINKYFKSPHVGLTAASENLI